MRNRIDVLVPPVAGVPSHPDRDGSRLEGEGSELGTEHRMNRRSLDTLRDVERHSRITDELDSGLGVQAPSDDLFEPRDRSAQLDLVVGGRRHRSAPGEPEHVTLNQRERPPARQAATLVC